MVLKEKISLIMSRDSFNYKSNFERDILIVQNYFGLGSIQNPTYEKVAELVNLGTRERVRQIIKSKFVSKVDVNEVSEISEIIKICESKKFHVVSDLLVTLNTLSLVEIGVSFKGVLNLLHTFNYLTDYNLYTAELKKANNKDVEEKENLYLIEKNRQSTLNKTLRKVRKHPGKRGICNLYNVFDCMKYQISDLDEIVEIITKQRNSWTMSIDKNELWYLFEDRDNTIVNILEKIVNLESNVRVDILSEVIQSYITKRSSKLSPPPIGIIVAYINNSKFLNINGDYAFINADRRKLTDIEGLILDYYSQNNCKISRYPELKEYLEKYDWTKVYIDKSIYHSPFIYVEKSKGRKNFELILISQFTSSLEEQKNEYIIFKNRLKSLYGETDINVRSKARREQVMLREWLFGDESTSTCAICNKEHKISALVAAHKKKRALCSEGERTDPNIVMPMCLFGCDYLYENEYIEIINGKINVIITEGLTSIEIEYLEALDGRDIEKRWLRGNKAYFRKRSLNIN